MILAGAAAAEDVGQDVYSHTGHWGEREIEEPDAWKEDATLLPPAPEDKDLVAVPSDLGAYTLSLDAKHLSVGPDEVLRYTVVLSSRSGARNVYFEGLRCDAKEYKTYGYGTGDGQLHEFPGAAWQPVVRTGPAPYRFELMRGYFCDSVQRPRRPEVVLEMLSGNTWRRPDPGSAYDQ